MRWCVMLLLIVFIACSSDDPGPAPQAGTVERERADSVIGKSQLPGAGVAQRANAARDSSRSRAAAIDSIRD
jgi:hypothetical protein